jgi:hypothetical protein
MNRYVVVRALNAMDSGSPVGSTANYLVVDLTQYGVVADTGDYQPTADKVATALNAYDGGPL